VEKLTRDSRELPNEEFHDLSSSSDIIWGDQIKKNEMGEACGTHWERRGTYRVLVE
jgi:hypothetical protein